MSISDQGLFQPETTNLPLECADHLFEKGGFTRGAHRGRKHALEVMERWQLAAMDRGHDANGASPVEIFEDSAEKESLKGATVGEEK